MITIRAVCVLQAETGLVSLCDPRAVQSQQVIVREHLDAVIVPGTREWESPVEIMRVCVSLRSRVHLRYLNTGSLWFIA